LPHDLLLLLFCLSD